MAKTNDSKNDVKKLQKEIATLKNKLKMAEKKSNQAEKNWQKKHRLFQKDMAKQLADAHQSGYQTGLSESEKKAAARKKALHAAEITFEKDYRQKPTKTKAAKKTTKKVKTKSRVAKASAKPKQKVKKTKVSAKPTKAKKTALKRRGRPAKAKFQREKGMMDSHPMNHHHSDMSVSSHYHPEEMN